MSDNNSFAFIPGDSVNVPEIKYKDNVVLPADKTSVIIVDMQNDFIKEGGSLVVPSAIETVGKISNLLYKARNKNVRIAYTQDTQVEDDPEWDIWPVHCRINSWGWNIIDELKPEENDLICRKNRYDGFYGSWLGHFLSNIWRVKNVVIAGTVSNICVLHTAASAGLRWFNIIIPADGISALTEFEQALTLHQVSSLYAGDVLKSADSILFE